MKKQQVITITTDFGDDFASSQLQAVIACLDFEGKIIENHSISPFSISEGAFEIKVLSKFSPEGTVHLGVVDPGVGSKRRGIVIQTKNFWYVGPDNGLFYEATKDTLLKVWKIQDVEVISQEISHTFHGRDIFVKVAVYLAQGKNPEEIGCVNINHKTLKKFTFVVGQVLHTDHYGNIKIYWPHKIIQGKILTIENNGHKLEVPIVKTFTDVSKGKPLALLGSSETLELAINLGHASNFYNIKTDDILNIYYKK